MGNYHSTLPSTNVVHPGRDSEDDQEPTEQATHSPRLLQRAKSTQSVKTADASVALTPNSTRFSTAISALSPARSSVVLRLLGKNVVPPKKYKGKVLLVGLHGAGKTSLLQQFHELDKSNRRLEEQQVLSLAGRTNTSKAKGIKAKKPLMRMFDPWTSPPFYITFPASSKATQDRLLAFGALSYAFLDLPGRPSWRPHWYDPEYMEATVAVVLVVDASDSMRFPLVAHELDRLMQLKKENLAYSHLEIYFVANKVDLVKTLQASEVLKAMETCQSHDVDEENQIEVREAEFHRQWASMAYQVYEEVVQSNSTHGGRKAGSLLKRSNVYACTAKSPWSINCTFAWINERLQTLK